MEKEKNIELRGALIGAGVIFLYLIAYSFPSEVLGILGINYNNLHIAFKSLYLIIYEISLTTLII